MLANLTGYTHTHTLKCVRLFHVEPSKSNRFFQFDISFTLSIFGMASCPLVPLFLFSLFSAIQAYTTEQRFSTSGFSFFHGKTFNVWNSSILCDFFRYRFISLFLLYCVIIPHSTKMHLFSLSMCWCMLVSLIFFYGLWAHNMHEICIFSTYLFAFQHFSFGYFFGFVSVFLSHGFLCFSTQIMFLIA